MVLFAPAERQNLIDNKRITWGVLLQRKGFLVTKFSIFLNDFVFIFWHFPLLRFAFLFNFNSFFQNTRIHKKNIAQISSSYNLVLHSGYVIYCCVNLSTPRTRLQINFLYVFIVCLYSFLIAIFMQLNYRGMRVYGGEGVGGGYFIQLAFL